MTVDGHLLSMLLGLRLLVLLLLVFELIYLIQLSLVFVMNKVTSWSVRAESNSMECATQFCLVLRMTSESPELMSTVCKLALITVFAMSAFLKRPT